MNEGRILEPYSGLLQKSVPVCLFKIAGNLSLWTIVKTWTIKFVNCKMSDVAQNDSTKRIALSPKQQKL